MTYPPLHEFAEGDSCLSCHKFCKWTNAQFYFAANMERLRRSASQMEQTGGTVHEIGALSDDD